SAGTPCLWDAASRLGACGDWCEGPRVEAAFLSGVALAAKIAEAL
ncbi:NAD(P)/FAD-dependent oxidoreductase, partial [Ralstonia pseudosolanacearum]